MDARVLVRRAYSDAARALIIMQMNVHYRTSEDRNIAGKRYLYDLPVILSIEQQRSTTGRRGHL